MGELGQPLFWFSAGAACFLLIGLVIFVLRRPIHRRRHQKLRAEASERLEVLREDLNAVIDDLKERLERRNTELDRLREESRAERVRLDSRESDVEERMRALRQREEAIERLRRLYRERMERLAQEAPEEIHRRLVESVQNEAKEEIQLARRQILEDGERDLQQEAQRILVDTVQRLASQPNHDVTATVVTLPSEDMKGRLIGREGRNIRAFEATTGVTLLIDETPDSVLVSSFDPVRREIARLALESLLRDGRIHPSSIEESVQKAEDEMAQNVIELGEGALRELHLGQLHPELVRLLGRMHYRLSNNQNSLRHSVEVAFICSLLASELGLDPEKAKKAGLLHDVGKAVSHEYEGSHAKVAAQLLRRYGESEEVINAVEAHHNEVPATSVYAPIVMIGDSLSATRPGARADSMDSYIQRVRNLESLAKEFPGVSDAYAIHAGREIRVIVEPDAINDENARDLAYRLRGEIEEKMTYPGTIKVTIIRETRFSETAK